MKRRLTNSGKIGPDGLGRKNYRWHSQTAAIFQISWSAERTYVKHEKVGLASFDHLVTAREQRLGASMPSAFAVGISGARKQWRVCCQAPNTSLVPVYDRITFFGNSALRIS